MYSQQFIFSQLTNGHNKVASYITQGSKVCPGANTLAYFSFTSMIQNFYIEFALGMYSQRFIFFVTYEWAQ
jgi:hypothetical protein